MIDLDTFTEKQDKSCKGLLFRGRSSGFISGKNIGFRKDLKLLKKKSCPGCEKCDWLWDILHETLSIGNIIGVDDILDGRLYRIETINHRKDWETGLVDDCDLIIVEGGIEND